MITKNKGHKCTECDCWNFKLTILDDNGNKSKSDGWCLECDCNKCIKHMKEYKEFMNKKVIEQLESIFEITICKFVELQTELEFNCYFVRAFSKDTNYPDNFEEFVFQSNGNGIFTCLNRAYWENHASKNFENCDSFIFFYQEGDDNYWNEKLLPSGEMIDYDLTGIFNQAFNF